MKKTVSLILIALLVFALGACSKPIAPPGATITDTLTGVSISLGQSQRSVEARLKEKGEYDAVTDSYRYRSYDITIYYEQNYVAEVRASQDTYSINGFTPDIGRDGLADWPILNTDSYPTLTTTFYIRSYDKDDNIVPRGDDTAVYDVSIAFNEDGEFSFLSMRLSGFN